VVNDSLAVAPAVYIGFRIPSVKDPRGPAATLLGDVIGSGKSSRLYESLVRQQQIATNVFSGNLGLVDGADILYIGVEGKPGASADSLEKATMAEVALLANFTRAELDRARAAERFQFVNRLQTTGGFGGRADRLAEGWTFFRDPNYVNRALSDFDKVTLSGLNALARQRMVPANRATFIYVPARKTAPPSASRMD
jgi:predicted Zn-dependent peptidase